MEKNNKQQTTKKKVLLTYMESGMGHITSMRSINDALYEHSDKLELLESYIMKEDGNKNQMLFERFIISQTKQTNKIKGYGNFVFFVMKALGGQKLLRATHNSIFKFGVTPTLKAFEKRKPDIIISTHYFLTYCGIEYIKKIDPNCKLVTYNPDNNVHLWWDNRNGKFVVNNHYAYQEAIIKRKFKRENVKEVSFTARQDIIDANKSKKEYRKEYGIDDKFTVIVADGVYASAKAKKTTKELLKSNYPLNILLIAGRNEKLFKKYSEIALNTKSNITLKVYPFMTKIYELYKAADLFITKGGPNAILDSVFMGTPVLVNYYAHPIEKATTILFTRKLGCGMYQPNIHKLKRMVEKFIETPNMLDSYILNTKKVDKTKNGAKDVAKIILEELNLKDETK